MAGKLWNDSMMSFLSDKFSVGEKLVAAERSWRDFTVEKNLFVERNVDNVWEIFKRCDLLLKCWSDMFFVLPSAAINASYADRFSPTEQRRPWFARSPFVK